MAKTFLCLAMVAAGFPAWAGALTLKVEPASLSALPGTPMPVELVVTNTSGGDLLLVGETLERAFQVKEALLCHPDGRAVLCESGSSEIILRSNAPPSTWPKVVFPAGGVRVIQQQISSQNTCPLDSVPPGDYVGRLAVEVVLWEGGQARPMVEAVQVSIKVLRPEGVDATALEALRQFLKNADPKALRGCTEQVKPLGWQEVLLSTRVPSTKILLEDFPTSTYAGYVLAKKVRDLSDWRLKVAPAEKFVEDARKRPHLFRECEEELEFFSLLERHLERGHVPGGLASQLYGFYGEQLLLRGREKEALAAFQKAAEEEPLDAKGKAYYQRSLAFLEALKKGVTPASPHAP